VPSWNDLLSEFAGQADDAARSQWLNDRLTGALADVGQLRGGRNVIFYGSAYLQKPELPPWATGISAEDVNALMSVIHGMDCAKGLTLLVHTPGGSPTAAETIVAYLRSKFDYIEVIVPTYAMSAGTMISLAANKIVMGRQSQLGPIDPQVNVGGRFVSAQAVVDQFNAAKDDIVQDTTLAHLWAPILQSQGPSLLQECQNALAYGERMVATWLQFYMLNGAQDPQAKAEAIAKHFNDAASHKSHGRRIDRDEARAQGLDVDDLEDSQDLQEAVLTAYHVATITFDVSPTAKMFRNDAGQSFLKNVTIASP
jgi:hypothetical protein